MLFCFFGSLIYVFFVCVFFFRKKLIFLLSLEIFSLYCCLFFFHFSSVLVLNFFSMICFTVFIVLESVMLISLYISSCRFSGLIHQNSAVL